MINRQIISTGTYLPKHKVLNSYFQEVLGLDTNDEWIITRAGIKSRYLSDETETAACMAMKAAQVAAGEEKEIKAIVVATSTNSQAFPSIAAQVHRSLNLPQDCICFDLNDACNGFVQAFSVAMSMIKHGEKAVVVGVDQMSSIVDYTDRSTCVLFGDGAGAVLIQKDESKQFASTSYTLSSYTQDLEAKPKVKMNGKVVFKFAIECISNDVKNILNKAGTPVEKVKYFIPHQANSRILDAVEKQVNLPTGVLINVVENYGNTSAATVPIALDHIKNRLSSGEILVMSGFAAGFRGGSVLVEI